MEFIVFIQVFNIIVIAIGTLLYMCCRPFSSSSSSSTADSDVADSAAVADDDDADIPPRREKYDVFISFRGEDTRLTFTSHLHAALLQKKIETYIDNRLQRGKEIGPALLEAIEKSAISVIVFSQNYASSTWCLDKLVHILKCKERYGQMVIPIFYHTNASDVRKQHRSYGDAFAQHQKRFKDSIDKVHKWREALTTAGNLSGFHLSENAGTDADLIKKVVKDIWTKLCRKSSYDLKGFVGIESRVEQIESLLGIHSPDACITVGIWGMDGIGKTTLAEAVFHRHSSKFEASCFVKNVRKNSEQADGLDRLEKALLKEILKEEVLPRGSTRVRERLSRTKVLIVLDDVSDSMQMERLAGDRLRYGTGSRIIITSRDSRTLGQTVEKDKIYEVQGLKLDDAIQLFCSRAFKNNSTRRTDYKELAEKAVDYAQSVPLALIVLGSLFFNCKTKQDWENEFNKLKRFPSESIQRVLRLSYDGLERHEKEIFLDLACFHQGRQVDMVKRMLDVRGFFARAGIRFLIDMSLISTDSKWGRETIEMHDLLEEMGRTIVQEQCFEDPGKRNRLFTDEDVYHVLKYKRETPIVEAIRVNWSKIEEQPLKRANFKKMCNLIMLIVDNSGIFDCKFTDSLDLPDSLRYLYWPEYPLESLPSKFSPENLVELHMPYSQVQKLWKEDQILVNLQVIDLAYSNLTEVPNLSGSPKIVHINLHGCYELVEIPGYFQHLDKLTHLDLGRCKNLKYLPEMPENIRYLDLRGSGIKELPESIWSNENISYLEVSHCKYLEKLPSNRCKLKVSGCFDLDNCTSLGEFSELPRDISKLSLVGCEKLVSLPTNICKLKYLEELDLSWCSELENFPEILEPMEHLKSLNLSGTAIEELHSSIESLPALKRIQLQGCKWLSSIPKSICKLKYLEELDLSSCSQLENFPEILEPMEHLESLNLSGTSIKELHSSIEFLPALKRIQLQDCKRLSSIPKSICKLKYLEELNLSRCSVLENFPEILEPKEHLKSLILSGTAIEDLHSSIAADPADADDTKTYDADDMAAASSSSAAAPSDADDRKTYDVFISFRGEDTRRTFTSHLHSALLEKKITTYIDDELKRGDEIAAALLKAIEKSQLSVIIFSKDYASSPWCLDELVHILECKEKHGLLVIPIFYDTLPSDVRKQRGSYAVAFDLLEQRFENSIDKVRKWRDALTTVANISGFDSKNYGTEADLIQKVVDHIWTQLCRESSCNLKGFVGIESRIEQIELLLGIHSQDACITVGIWGMAGIGKTTLAEAVFHRHSSKFEAACFLKNIRQISEQAGGLGHLEETLLKEILKEEVLPTGSTIVRERLSRTKVLIVLDDVSDSMQMERLAGDRLRYGTGSRVIITSRDRRTFGQTVEEDKIYEVQGLKPDDALQLFCSCAFKNSTPRADYKELAEKAVHYAGGVPLALTILGSLFFNCKSKEDWEDEFNELKRFPNESIQKNLRICYDSLEENEKKIFLDIACFHKGWPVNEVKRMLDIRGFFTTSGIRILIDMSLISIDSKWGRETIEMHDLLEEMGRTIVRDQCIEDPGKRNRLFTDEDVYHVLKYKRETPIVEAIRVNWSKIEELPLKHANFKKISNLIMLIVDSSGIFDSKFTDSLDLPDSLRYLYWPEYPLESLPSKFSPKNLVELHMPYSQVQKLWKEDQILVNLQVIDLASSNLTEVPNLSGSPKIVHINLHGCYELVEIPGYFQRLDKLTHLDLGRCKNLKYLPEMPENIRYLDLRGSGIKELPESVWSNENISYLELSHCKYLEKLPSNRCKLKVSGCFDLDNCTSLGEFSELPRDISKLSLVGCERLMSLPTNICKLKYLEELDLSWCSKLENFPEILEPMEHLKSLNLSGTAVEELHSSIEFLPALKRIQLQGCKRLSSIPKSICKLKYLEELDLSSCSQLENFPEILEPMEHLESLNLSGTSIKELHSSIEFLPALKRIRLQDCKRLSSIPKSICKLKYLEELNLSRCSELENFPEILEPMEHLKSLNLSGTAIEDLHSSIAADADDTKTYDADDMAAAPSDADDTNTYDVFISFRGGDSRRTFTSHLHAALLEKKITTYIDDELKRGDEIAPALLKAIEKSQLSVIIFSKDYASSPWCLDELVHILECKEKHGLLVIPIFYDTLPSDVRKQRGSYAVAFDLLEQRFENSIDKVRKWRDALTIAANISGYDSKNYGTDADLVKKVVEDILTKLCHESSCDLEGPVGIESRIKQIELLLGIHSQDACISVGIWGVGGIGKTTLAEAVFNKLSPKFEACCFLRNVREREQKHGLEYLQNTLLSQILKEEGLSIGSTFVRDRLSCTRVLIVLDDVSDSMQMEGLASNGLRFGTGSRIIITSKNWGTLRQIVEEDNIYEVGGLKPGDALQLFCSRAFKSNHTPRTDYKELAQKAVAYAGGVPLALILLGSSFLNCKSKEAWEDELNKLKEFPNENIQRVLRISYDGLGRNEKEIFLDIACFHKGTEVNKVIKMLAACGRFAAAAGIRVLADVSLISVHSKSSLKTIEMHDLVEEMGRTIVQEECTEDPGKSNWLFNDDDVYRVLKKNKETPIDQAIQVKKLTRLMSNLRLLIHRFCRPSRFSSLS